MITCVRMAEKGLLRREKAQKGYGYVYTATIGEREFVTRELAQVLDSIVRAYPSAPHCMTHACAKAGRSHQKAE